MKLKTIIWGIVLVSPFYIFVDWCFSQTVTVSWDASISSGVEKYNVYRGTLSRVYDNSISTTELQVQIFGLEQEKIYYFAVTAVDSSGNESDYSEEVSFILNSITGINENEIIHLGIGTGFIKNKTLGIKIGQNYPNPCNYATTILIDASEAKKEIVVVIRICDVRGRLVKELKLGGFTGYNTVAIDIDGMVSGIYLCAISGNGRPLGMMKMIIVK